MNPEKTLVSQRLGSGDLLSGIKLGSEPRNAYRTTDPEKKKELTEIKILTSELGKIAEHCVISTWTGHEIDPETKRVLQTCLADTTGFYQTEKKKFKNTNRDRKLFAEALVSNPHIAALIIHIDSIFSCDLWGLWEANVSLNLPYIIEASMAIAHEVLGPSQVKTGLLVPNVLLANPETGSLMSQLDAVDFINMPGQPMSYLDLIRSGEPYTFISIKMLFRDKYTKTPGRLSKPRQADRAQAQHQIARHAIWLKKSGLDGNFFPRSTKYVYLRGEYPTKVINEQVDYDYISQWLDGLDTKISLLQDLDEPSRIDPGDTKQNELIDFDYTILLEHYFKLFNRRTARINEMLDFLHTHSDAMQHAQQAEMNFDQVV